MGGPILRSADGVAVAKFTPRGRTDHVGDFRQGDGDNRRSAARGRKACTSRWRRGAGAESALLSFERPSLGVRRRSSRRSQQDRSPQGRHLHAVRQDKSGRILARCVVDGNKDITAELVRNGHVFATKSFFNSLSSEEEAARNAKAGIWQGEVARPQEWRERAWEDAKRDAPDGCRSRDSCVPRPNNTNCLGLPITAAPKSARKEANAGSAAKMRRRPPASRRQTVLEVAGHKKIPAVGGDRGQN